MKKKLLFVIPTLYNGGAEKSLVSLLQTIDAEEYDIDLLLFKEMGMFLKQVPDYVNIISAPKELKSLYSDGDYRKRYLKGIRIIGTGLSKLFTKSYVGQRQIRWKYFYKHILQNQEGEYDVAIAYMEGEPIYYVVDKVRAKKKIAWIHNDYKSLGCSDKFDFSYFKDVDNIVSVSKECVNILKEIFNEFEDKICYIPNLVSSKTIKKMSEDFYPREYNRDDIKILSIGRLNHQKGFDIAIESAKYLYERGYRFKWYIIGDGILENDLKNLIEKNNMQDNVFLIGTRENPYPYIKNCDIFAQTSRFEGKSISLDEAKILSKPILVTNYSTAKDQIINNKEGIIVDMSEKAIAEGLEILINDIEKRIELSEYLSRFEYGNKDLIDLYYKVIN